MANTTMTLDDAKEKLRKNVRQGAICPCCGQFVKVYRRGLTSSMAVALIEIYKFFKVNPFAEWLHVENHLNENPKIPAAVRADFHKLRHWGLIEAASGKRKDGNPHNGYYRITEDGAAFVEGRLSVVDAIHMFNGVVIGKSEIMVSIHDLLARKGFDYSKIIAPSDLKLQRDLF